MALRFLDNDVLLKLCQYGIENDFVNCCANIDTIRVLPTFKYKFDLRDETKALAKVKTRDGLKRLHNFLAKVAEADHLDDSDYYLNAFSQIDQIDSGEAILFALTALNDKSLTFTGDKRSISAFSIITDKRLLDALSGRVKCLEQSVAEILLSGNGSSIVDLINGNPWDTALRICFRNKNPKDIISALKSYYDDLARKCNGILAPFPNI